MRKSSVVRWASVITLTGMIAVVAAPMPAVAKDPKPGEKQCDVQDETLSELSGLAVSEDGYWAVGDGTADQSALVVAQLGGDCATVGGLNGIDANTGAPTDPFDPEDLAIDGDGNLWVADTGDNDGARDRIALHKITPDGSTSTYRFTYPDRPHDTEAMLLQPNGMPIFATKDPGESKLYTPTAALDGALDEANPMPMEEIGSFKIKSTDTPGGPEKVHGISLGDLASTLVTGGAVSSDGKRAVLRTYTDAYEWSVKDGDVGAALTGKTEPTVTPLPDEPQGEAIAYTADDKFVTASEAVTDDAGTVTSAPGLWTYTPNKGGSGDTKDDAGGNDSGGSDRGFLDSLIGTLGPDGILWVIAGIGVIGLIMVVVGWRVIVLSRKRRRMDGDEPSDDDDYDDQHDPLDRRDRDDAYDDRRYGRADDGLSGGRLFDESPSRAEDEYEEWPNRDGHGGNVYGGPSEGRSGNVYGGSRYPNDDYDEGGSGNVYGGSRYR
jgi:hypothetical protein